MNEIRTQEEGPEAKRRKIRKGTRSCWECKRRKVRCIFTSPANIVCDNCRRRGTGCISQEHPDPPAPFVSSNHVETRLGRVEELLEQLVHKGDTAHALHYSPEDLSEARSTLVTLDEVDRTELASSAINTPTSTDSGRRVRPASPAVARTKSLDGQVSGKYENLVRDLIVAWPNQRDLNIICNLPVGLSAHLHPAICSPSYSFTGQDPPSPREMLQLPPPSSHPVLIARKLLVLGTFLQGVLPSAMQSLRDQGASYRDLMARVVDRAIRLVTTNDELIGSVEGIECILIEAMYQNYAGNLHQAWMAMRRAAAIAQMMALHRGLDSRSLKILEPEAKASFNPDHICFRLVEMDRYLSLMLGLPPASLEARFATPKALEGCHPIDRIQRIHCAVAGRILRCNGTDLSSLARTHDIDRLLQKAAAEMPPQWWLIPNFVSRNNDRAELQADMVRLNAQFAQQHLLLRLHLPYMLRFPSDHRYDHSKITTVNASREILSRYATFRTANPAHFYCRGIDFLAFVATTVLCLAHIESHGQRHQPSQTPNFSTIFNYLAHSRPSDRGTMERTLEIMDSMARTGTDMIASKLTRIIHHLLTVEAAAANGTIYSASSCKGDGGELEYDGKMTDSGTSLHIYLPYFGTIKFERGSISTSASTALTKTQLGVLTPSATDRSLEHNDLSLSTSNFHIGNQLVSPNSHLQDGQLLSSQHPSATDEVPCISSCNLEPNQLPIPPELSGVDEWGLQDVDVAIFNSLFRDIAIPDAVEEETWAQ
ncbi:uncharacterized protein BDW43DRAFT_274837 [Aspergillus alliaceus]|uniref:uncharacterized protein n=1 Tax=Petromyces alliaceus TaxID=209559 RepID=UPI0012A3B816|nr:uncharacterized protein BDW43DRAFT_274837 [Aspergillus alliaceus]KAB8234038.1 hypothetical protein BDW43DRAFT_274837 [Aspergillus alliaceus]